MSTAKEQASVSVRLRIRYHKQHPNYSTFDPNGPPIPTYKVQREISKLRLPYCRNDAIEVPLLGHVQCEWYFEEFSKVPHSMALRLRPEQNSIRAQEIDDWMRKFCVFKITATYKQRGHSPQLIVKYPKDPSFSDDLDMYPISGSNKFIKNSKDYPTPTRVWGVKAIESNHQESPASNLGRCSLTAIDDTCSNEHEQSRSPSSIASTRHHSRGPATTLVDHDSTNSLVPPPTSSTLVGDPSVDENWPKPDAKSIPRRKRGRDVDDFVPREHSSSLVSKRSRWAVAPTGSLSEMSRSRYVSSSANCKSSHPPSRPRLVANKDREDSRTNHHRHLGLSVSQYDFRRSYTERWETEDIPRSPRRTYSPSLSTANYPEHLLPSSGPVVHSSRRISHSSTAEQPVPNTSVGIMTFNNNRYAATTSSAAILSSSLLPIAPVDYTKLYTAISTATAPAASASLSDSLPTSDVKDANCSPSASSSVPAAGEVSSTISMSDINALLEALPTASLPARQQVTELSSAAGVGSSTQSAPTYISTGTPVAPIQTPCRTQGYPHPVYGDCIYEYSSYTKSTSQAPTSITSPATPVSTTGATLTANSQMESNNEPRIKEELENVTIDIMNHGPTLDELESSSNPDKNNGTTRIVQLRSDLLRLRKEISERVKREKTVLAELAELAEESKTDFVLGEVDGCGLEVLGTGTSFELGLGLKSDDEVMERPNSSDIARELRSNLLIMQAQLGSERNGRKKAEQDRRDAEFAKRETEHALKEVELRLSEAEHFMNEAEQRRKADEFAKSELENAKKEAVERRREAEQLRGDADYAKQLADDWRKKAEKGMKDAEDEKHRADNQRREADQARRDAEHARQRAESDKRDVDDQRRMVEQAKHDVESALREMEQQWKDAEFFRREAEERRREAEAFVVDVKRECREPFVVPALMDAFLNISKLTNTVGEMPMVVLQESRDVVKDPQSV
ncbi:hypothetical protein J3R30DRAFT_3890734 [Lentinula aciculospora]|uniref:Uncharacterized protein n=1 Tax=Lentinula aciculospora TaxID=153920 RepID=A0A9W9DNC0_9AGAR|nr:hypothetical protein J3R30DRAFT_3890734 [Lentinula aciculospora]